MAVDQERGSKDEAGRHGRGFAGIEPDQHEAEPGRAVALGFGSQLVQEGLLELEDLLDVHAGDEGLGGSAGGIGKDDVFEGIVGGGQDGGALVDLRGIEEVENGEVLDLEDLVHALDGEAALAVEEIRNVGLFKSRLLGKTESGELSFSNSVQENFAEIVLQGLELH